MDFDNAKENIMPLAGGRDARCLETVLSVESHHEGLMLLKKQREEYENAIHEYVGDDPLEPWFNYIQWIEQSYPSGGKENGLFDVLNKCLTTFGSEKKYFQDRRMIKLLIKHIDSQSNPQEYYQELYNQGIGTMVSDLYICWAYYYDLCGNFTKAEEVFRKGLDAKAQPLDELEQAHKHFGFTMSQRILYKDEASNLQFMSSMQERRQALTSLRTQKKKVGSIRTGTAIKNHNPGRIELSKATGPTSNIAVKVFEDENHDPNAVEPPTKPVPVQDVTTPRSVVRSIIDSTRKQENMREPGPWSKARIHDKKRCDLFGSSSNHELAFEIMQDDDVGYCAPLPKGEDKYSIGIQLPPDFVQRNTPLPQWEVPLYSDPGTVGPHIYPQYEKTHLYPKENEVYCPEEYAAWQWFNKLGITNEFTEKHDHVWCANFEYGFHHYPKFCMKNVGQIEFVTKRHIQDENLASDQVLVFPIPEVYPEDCCEEFQIEEIRGKRIRDGKRKLNLNMDETIIMREDLDETECVAGVTGRDRRSIFPARRSIVPKIMQTIVESPRSQSSITGNGGPITSSQGTTGVRISTGGNISKPVEVPAAATAIAVPNKEEEKHIQEVVSNEDASNRPAVEKIRDVDMIENLNENDGNLRTVDNLRVMKKFDIYEDTDQGGDCVFKAPQVLPQATARSVKSRKSVVPLQDDPIEEKTNLFPESETTCSTQTFNFFITGHAVSTPKHLRKSQSYTTQLQERPSQPEFASPPTDVVDEDALSTTNSNTQYPPKQLSIIMETTETNTGSSGTKSSGETQELEIESNKSHQTTKIANKEKCVALDSILEVSSYDTQTLQKPPRTMQHVKEITTVAIEDSIPALTTSLRVFEDKTETVPKMLLVKPPMNVPSNDNFEIHFTTTPPKGATKVNCSAINESLTFSKLSEVTIPKMEEVGKGNISTVLKEAPTKKENKPGSTGAISKKTEPSLLRSFAINDSISFSNLKNFTMSNLLEKDGMGKNEKVEHTSKWSADKSLTDKSLPQLFDISAAFADENVVGTNKNMRSTRKTSFTAPKEGDISQSNHLKKIESPVDRSFTHENKVKHVSYIGRPSVKTDISLLQGSRINEPSLHIKEEAGNECNMALAAEQRKPECSLLSGFSALSRRQADADHPVISERVENFPGKDRSIDMSSLALQKDIKRGYCDLGRSIYKKSPGTPEFPRHIWVDEDSRDSNSANNFVHDDIDLDLTKQLIEAKIDENANPFDPELIKAFLDQVDLCSFVENLPECLMVNRVEPLQQGSSVHVADKQLYVMKFIGEGSYGSVFRAKDRLSGKVYAIKQERPANLWEYYICLELKSRISPNMMFGFMNVEYAVIGNNASLLITQFSEYGSLIDVCHKVHKATGKNLDEYVVMVIASQLLSIMDHLHASNIIHADVKPDNFLLMSKLAYPSKVPSVQLIDFGVSIDLRLFPPKQSFKYATRTQGFTCIEMSENRPWTYQPDLFGLAGTIHALLFGKYMDVERKGANWEIKTHLPRYFSKTLWSVIFNALLNIRDCESMPNLQYLRGLLEEEIVEKQKIVKDKISEFNLSLN